MFARYLIASEASLQSDVAIILSGRRPVWRAVRLRRRRRRAIILRRRNAIIWSGVLQFYFYAAHESCGEVVNDRAQSACDKTDHGINNRENEHSQYPESSHGSAAP